MVTSKPKGGVGSGMKGGVGSGWPIKEKAGNTMTKILVSKDTLYGARVGLPKKKNIVQLPEEIVHFPPSEAIVTIPPCWVSPRVAIQPAAVITRASLPAVRHEGGRPSQYRKPLAHP